MSEPVRLRAIDPRDADALFPMIHRTPVTDTLIWDGPASLGEYREGLRELAAKTETGETYAFTIVAGESPIGCMTLRPAPGDAKAVVGLWIGERYHGKGYGTAAIARVLEYAFDRLGLNRVEAAVFTGNLASRRIFEKNGFALKETVRQAVKKKGEPRDEWRLAISRSGWIRYSQSDGHS